MKTKKFQEFMDRLIDKTLLWLVPKWLKPNFFTWLRIISVPFLFWLLATGQLRAGIILFVLSASTDFIDGALARTRDQITEMGKIIDPIADKMLVATVLAAIGLQYLIVRIFLVFIGMEIVTVLLAAFLAYGIGRPPGANFFGKIKMILQCFAIIVFILGLIFSIPAMVEVATVTLFVALGFAILSGYQQINAKITRILAFLKIDRPLRTLKELLRKI